MEEILNKLKAFFERKEEIAMAFLFGSAARGREIPESDIDLAIWFNKEYTLEEVDKIWLEVEAILHRNVDLVVLNQARPTIAWAALRGKKIIIRDHRLYFSKLLNISREAEDMQDFILDLFHLKQKLRKEVNK